MSNIDFDLAWEGASDPGGPWQHLRVVELRGTEGISTLYRYEITAHARSSAPAMDPDELVGSRATLRIATHAEPPYRLVHGIFTEAEELGTTGEGTLYRLVLSPPLARTMHRSRCRIFLEKTLRQILEAVLQGDSGFTADTSAAVTAGAGALDFTPARELYAFRVSQSARFDQVTARPYCVQYNESDFAFLSRLLEEEGIGYHFEHGDGACLLVLADLDTGRSRLEPFLPLGPKVRGRELSAMKLGARLRARKVSLQDYDWKKPALAMAVEQAGGAGDLVDHEYPGRYLEAPDLGKPLAAARLERLGFEASYALGEGTCRLLAAGQVFALENMSGRHDGEYLVTRMEVRGTQPGELALAASLPGTGESVPYTATFECARRGKGTESRFRPARVTPRPRILGVQTAVVTAEPGASGKEIHVGGPPGGEIGCVRVKFHWDQDGARQAKEPTSCWVRVSQVFAGAGQGAVWHPRVGVEVLVELEEGDPDRPIVVGRVYNGQNKPPTVVPELSTMKSMTSPGDGTYNELTFDDTAGKQRILLHASRDWNSEVAHDRSETVTNDSTSSVVVNRAESTGADRTTSVGGNNAETVTGNETITVGGNQTVDVGADQLVNVGGDQTISVAKNQQLNVTVDQTVGITGKQTVAVTGDRSLKVTGDLDETFEKNRRTTITAKDELTVHGEQSVTVDKAQTTNYQADHHLEVTGSQFVSAGLVQIIDAGGEQTLSSGALQKIVAPTQLFRADKTQTLESNELHVQAKSLASIGLETTNKVQLHGVDMSLDGTTLSIKFSGKIEISGTTVAIKATKELSLEGNPVTVNGGAEAKINATVIKLNC